MIKGNKLCVGFITWIKSKPNLTTSLNILFYYIFNTRQNNILIILTVNISMYWWFKYIYIGFLNKKYLSIAKTCSRIVINIKWILQKSQFYFHCTYKTGLVKRKVNWIIIVTYPSHTNKSSQNEFIYKSMCTRP